MKVAELIRDWELWPRHEAQALDGPNVKRMIEALEAGIVLPPPIADEKSFRVIDGFHRLEAYDRLYGPEHKIEVELRTYKDDAEMLLEAGRLNWRHGLQMTPKDRAHFFLKCRRHKIPATRIAEALGVKRDVLQAKVKSRVLKTESGEQIAVSAGARHLVEELDGKPANAEQEHFARTGTALLPEAYISILLNALRADGSIRVSEKVRAKLEALRDEIDRFLESMPCKEIA